jgi:hypothetical protein
MGSEDPGERPAWEVVLITTTVKNCPVKITPKNQEGNAKSWKV